MVRTREGCEECQQSASAFTCECKAAGVGLCSACILGHLALQGTHVISTLAVECKELCSVCNRREAGSICCCLRQGTVLCFLCAVQHFELGIEHRLLPLRAKPYIGQRNYAERLRVREMTLLQGLKELEANLDTINTCEESLIKRVDNTIQDIISYRDTTIEELKAIREEIQALAITARKEIDEHLYEDSFQPQDQLTTSLWNFKEGNLQLFTYREEQLYKVRIIHNQPTLPPDSSCTFPSVIEVNIPSSSFQLLSMSLDSSRPPIDSPTLEESHSYVPVFDYSHAGSDSAITIYTLSPRYIDSFNVVTERQESTVLSKPLEISTTSAYCVLNYGTVWVCGGDSPFSRLVYEIEPIEGFVHDRPSMLNMRFAHAVLQYEENIYVFGGSDGRPMKHCEGYALSAEKWRNCASMITPRSFFNPCVSLEFVYLFGGRNTNQGEMYDVLEDKFTSLPVLLPLTGCASALFVDESHIAILQTGIISYWNCEDEEMSSWSVEHLSSPWGSASPLLWESKVYIPRDTVQVVALS